MQVFRSDTKFKSISEQINLEKREQYTRLMYTFDALFEQYLEEL
jgi:uncharacterized protein YozE (UPF0346 family)